MRLEERKKKRIDLSLGDVAEQQSAVRRAREAFGFLSLCSTHPSECPSQSPILLHFLPLFPSHTPLFPPKRPYPLLSSFPPPFSAFLHLCPTGLGYNRDAVIYGNDLHLYLFFIVAGQIRHQPHTPPAPPKNRGQKTPCGGSLFFSSTIPPNTSTPQCTHCW